MGYPNYVIYLMEIIWNNGYVRKLLPRIWGLNKYMDQYVQPHIRMDYITINLIEPQSWHLDKWSSNKKNNFKPASRRIKACIAINRAKWHRSGIHMKLIKIIKICLTFVMPLNWAAIIAFFSKERTILLQWYDLNSSGDGAISTGDYMYSTNRIASNVIEMIWHNTAFHLKPITDTCTQRERWITKSRVYTDRFPRRRGRSKHFAYLGTYVLFVEQPLVSLS